MNNAYDIMDYLKEAHPNGQKVAKINQEKIKRLKKNYHMKWEALSNSTKNAVENKVPTNSLPISNAQTNSSSAAINSAGTSSGAFQNITQTVSASPIDNSSVSPNAASTIISADKVKEKHDRVIKNYNMVVYKKNYELIPLYLTGARKIRTSQVTKANTGEFFAKSGTEDFKIISSVSESNKLNESNNIFAIETAKNQTNTLSASVSSPSVDDYLQKEVSNSNCTDLINQKQAKVFNLQAEKEAKEKKLAQMRQQREQREQQKKLAELDEEALGLTIAIEGLDAEILKEAAMIENMNNEVA